MLLARLCGWCSCLRRDAREGPEPTRLPLLPLHKGIWGEELEARTEDLFPLTRAAQEYKLVLASSQHRPGFICLIPDFLSSLSELPAAFGPGKLQHSVETRSAGSCLGTRAVSPPSPPPLSAGSPPLRPSLLHGQPPADGLMSGDHQRHNEAFS